MLAHSCHRHKMCISFTDVVSTTYLVDWTFSAALPKVFVFTFFSVCWRRRWSCSTRNRFRFVFLILNSAYFWTRGSWSDVVCAVSHSLLDITSAKRTECGRGGRPNTRTRCGIPPPRRGQTCSPWTAWPASPLLSAAPRAPIRRLLCGFRASWTFWPGCTRSPSVTQLKHCIGLPVHLPISLVCRLPLYHWLSAKAMWFWKWWRSKHP